MKENTGPILKKLSNRAQEFLSTPRHILAINPSESADNKWFWDFTLLKLEHNDFQSDKILTLFYFNKSGSVLESLLLETLSRMMIGKDIFFLLRLSFRELENFLRDENHLPSFDNLEPVSPELSFKAVKNSLLVALLIKEIEKKSGDISHSNGWGHLTLVQKNQKAHAFVKRINNLFSREKPIQLAIAENDEMAIIMNDFPVNMEVVEELARLIFGSEEEISSFKVVAVQ